MPILLKALELLIPSLILTQLRIPAPQTGLRYTVEDNDVSLRPPGGSRSQCQSPLGQKVSSNPWSCRRLLHKQTTNQLKPALFKFWYLVKPEPMIPGTIRWLNHIRIRRHIFSNSFPLKAMVKGAERGLLLLVDVAESSSLLTKFKIFKFQNFYF